MIGKMPTDITNKAETGKTIGLAELGVNSVSDCNVMGYLGNNSFLHPDFKGKTGTYSTSK